MVTLLQPDGDSKEHIHYKQTYISPIWQTVVNNATNNCLMYNSFISCINMEIRTDVMEMLVYFVTR